MASTYELDADDSPTDGVFEAVASADERSVLDLPPLGGTVDPDALDALLDSDSAVRRIVFEYAGWRVTATPEAVRVAPNDDE